MRELGDCVRSEKGEGGGCYGVKLANEASPFP